MDTHVEEVGQATRPMGSLLPVLVLVTSCGSMARVQRHGGEAADAMDGALGMFEQLE